VSEITEARCDPNHRFSCGLPQAGSSRPSRRAWNHAPGQELRNHAQPEWIAASLGPMQPT